MIGNRIAATANRQTEAPGTAHLATAIRANDSPSAATVDRQTEALAMARSTISVKVAIRAQIVRVASKVWKTAVVALPGTVPPEMEEEIRGVLVREGAEVGAARADVEARLVARATDPFWWRAFNDAALDRLVEIARRQNLPHGEPRPVLRRSSCCVRPSVSHRFPIGRRP